MADPNDHSDDRIELAYWQFDFIKKTEGINERDAFKRVVRSLLADLATQNTTTRLPE